MSAVAGMSAWKLSGIGSGTNNPHRGMSAHSRVGSQRINMQTGRRSPLLLAREYPLAFHAESISLLPIDPD